MTTDNSSNPAPADSGTFQFTTFGAVTVTNGNRVQIPENLKADLVNAAKWLATQPNSTHLGPIEVAGKAASDLLRRQVRQFAGDSNLSCGFKGQATKDTPALKNDKGVPFNDGTHVTFRLAPHREPQPASEVTVTYTEPTAPRPVDRGHAILNK